MQKNQAPATRMAETRNRSAKLQAQIERQRREQLTEQARQAQERKMIWQQQQERRPANATPTRTVALPAWTTNTETSLQDPGGQMTKKRDCLQGAQNLLKKPRAVFSAVMVGITARHMPMRPGTTPDEQRQATLDQITHIEEWHKRSQAAGTRCGNPAPLAPRPDRPNPQQHGPENKKNTLKRDKRYTPPQPPRQGQEPDTTSFLRTGKGGVKRRERRAAPRGRISTPTEY